MFRCFKTILYASVIVGVLLGLWRLTYDKSCFSLVFVLLILGIVAYSHISLKMHHRRCFAKCFVNKKSRLFKMLHSPIMVSCFYFIFSIFTSVSIACSVLDYNWMMWGIVFCTIVVCAAVFGVFEKMLKNIIKEDYLMLMSREASSFIGTLFFFVLSCYVIYTNNIPGYLKPALIDTIKAASDSAYSNCDYISYVLEFKKMLEGFAWWGMFKAKSMGMNKGFMFAGWVVFIIYNAFSGIAINRLNTQIIYWLSKYFRGEYGK
ncbi:Hypothetical protein HPV225_0361 [Helicobacter pylori v225d]|uniref:hypothetical protein n=1 Tax=Helicobacter pylori TaxID=210 RepID=UPI0001D8EC63|nr:hypothetical protein [Helicobacter pylori]ADI34449.1 Hypothetical protein HPV225_0361 [Helicobacter pylori v225d]